MEREDEIATLIEEIISNARAKLLGGFDPYECNLYDYASNWANEVSPTRKEEICEIWSRWWAILRDYLDTQPTKFEMLEDYLRQGIVKILQEFAEYVLEGAY